MQLLVLGLVVGVAGFNLWEWLSVPQPLSKVISSNVLLLPIKSHPTVFCWVPSKTHIGPVLKRITKTWLSTCDKFIITSTQSNPEFNVVKIDYPTDKQLWNMIHPAWTYVEQNYIDQYDWFVKLDDDSYFSAGNFKHLVREVDPESFYYVGGQLYMVQGKESTLFNTGGGYALSRASLRRLALYLPQSARENRVSKEQQCDEELTWAEDVKLGKCLHLAGGIGYPNNSRDAWNRERFMIFQPERSFLKARRP
ncbi:hypothetical protein BASA81_000561 [Batrachochytrium salamandrivorans]|nr:hypothetical protein BASA81_000561 [Batrachochytrium salamandrivorans]